MDIENERFKGTKGYLLSQLRFIQYELRSREVAGLFNTKEYMEINITHLIHQDMTPYSGSVNELGVNAGKITWNNAKKASKQRPLLPACDVAILQAKRYLKTFGAWEDLDTWNEDDINALVFQLIAGDIREIEAYDTFEDYLQASEEGQVSGHIFKTEENEYFYYLGE